MLQRGRQPPVMSIAEISNKSIKALGLTPAGPSDTAGIRKNLRALWDVFISPISEEVETNGKCSMVAIKRGTRGRLLLENADGQRFGPIQDPLNVSEKMLKMDLEKIEFFKSHDGPFFSSSIEKVLLALLSGGFRSISGVPVSFLDDFFVDETTRGGCPILHGTAYYWSRKSPKDRKGKPGNGTGALEPEQFRDMILGIHSAKRIIEILRSSVVPHHEKTAIESLFVPILLAKARWFNEFKGDIGSAVRLWRAVYDLDENQGTRVIQTMMTLAHNLADLSLPREKRDIGSAIKLWSAVHGLNFSGEQNAKVVSTMLLAAGMLADASLPEERRDVDSAMKIWQAVYDLDESQRVAVITRMMTSAHGLADTSMPGEERDIHSAIRLWSAVHGLNFSADQNQRVVSIMMNVAGKLTDISLPPALMDVDSAIATWKAVYDLQRNQRVNVIKAMMTAAHGMADFCLPKRQRDIDAAMRLWSAVFGLGFSTGQNQRVVLTVMSVASRPGSEDFRREAIASLQERKSRVHDRFFHARILSGLYFFSGNFQQAIDYIDSSGRKDPSILVVKADALRESGRCDSSIDLSSSIISKYAKKARMTMEEREGLIQAYCCRGFCYLQKGRRDESGDVLARAAGDFKEAVNLARNYPFLNPSRAQTGIDRVKKALSMPP